MRDNVREYVYGTAHVHSVSPPPFAGSTGRCDMHLLVTARGISGVVVRVRDPEVPVRKWPDAGATLPVIIPNGNPRRTQVLWDQVRTHSDVAAAEEVYGERYPDDDLTSTVDYGADLAVDELVLDDMAAAPGSLADIDAVADAEVAHAAAAAEMAEAAAPAGPTEPVVEPVVEPVEAAEAPPTARAADLIVVEPAESADIDAAAADMAAAAVPPARFLDIGAPTPAGD